MLLILWSGVAYSEELFPSKEVCRDTSHIIRADSEYCTALPTIEECQIIMDEAFADWSRNNPPSKIKWLSDRRWKKYTSKRAKIIRTGKPAALARLYLNDMICEAWEDEGYWVFKPSQWALDIGK